MAEGGKPITLTDESFEGAVSEGGVVIVDFWAAWCFPCLMVAPIVESLASEFSGKVVFGKLNIDENPKTAVKYGVKSVPTFLMFKDGKLVDTMVGAVPKEFMKDKINSFL